MLTTSELYREAGGNYFQRLEPQRTIRRLVRQLQALGHEVTLQPLAA